MAEFGNIGLVLSGGGYRGFAHLGALKALDEQGIKAHYVSGTSAGAIVGAFYAAGYSWSAILEFFKTTDVYSLRRFALGKPGMFDSDKYYQVFKDYFPDDSFEALKTPLFIAATDLIENKTRYFHKGPLIKPLLASAAFPGVFSPVEIQGHLLCDGGVTNNFPVEPLLIHCEHIIGVYVNPLKKIDPKDLKTSAGVAERAFYILRARDSGLKFKDCQILIAPKGLDHYSVLSNKNGDEIFQIGYEEAKKQLNSS